MAAATTALVTTVAEDAKLSTYTFVYLLLIRKYSRLEEIDTRIIKWVFIIWTLWIILWELINLLLALMAYLLICFTYVSSMDSFFTVESCVQFAVLSKYMSV